MDPVKDAMEAVKAMRDQLPALSKRIDDVIGEGKTRDERLATFETAVKSIEDLVKQYADQMPKLRAADLTARDPGYGGFWKNADQAKTFGMLLLAGLHPNSEVRSTCADAVVKSGVTLRTARGKFVKGENFVKAMVEGTDALGGYLVPDEFIPQLIRNIEAYGVARARLTKVPMSRQTQTWPKRTGGFTVYYPDEGVAVTASDLAFGTVQLTARKWAVLTSFSKELEEDAAIGLGEVIGMEFALALAIAEDTNTFQGDGTAGMGTVTGVLASTNVAVKTMVATKTSFTNLSDDNLIDLKRAVPTWARRMPDAAYFMSPDVAGIAEKLRDGQGLPLFQRATDDFSLRIHGHPVVETLAMPDITDDDVSTKFIAFGSLRAWGYLGQRRAMSIERSDQVGFLEDLIYIKAVPRQDIKEVDGNAMSVLRTAAS